MSETRNLSLAEKVEGLKRDTVATTDALLERLTRAEHIIATIAVNCQRTSDPVVLVQTLAVLDFAAWLDTGVYPEPDAAFLRAKGEQNGAA